MSDASQPTPPYTQPGQPGQPAYPTAPYGAPAPHPSGGTLGRTALIIAAIGLALSVIISLISPLFYISPGRFVLADVIGAVQGFLVLVVSGVALVLGVIAIRRQAMPVLGGIAVGVAAAGIVGVLTGALTTLIIQLMLR